MAEIDWYTPLPALNIKQQGTFPSPLSQVADAYQLYIDTKNKQEKVGLEKKRIDAETKLAEIKANEEKARTMATLQKNKQAADEKARRNAQWNQVGQESTKRIQSLPPLADETQQKIREDQIFLQVVREQMPEYYAKMAAEMGRSLPGKMGVIAEQGEQARQTNAAALPGKIEMIDAYGQNAMKRTIQMGQDRLSQIAATGEQNRQTAAAKPLSGGGSSIFAAKRVKGTLQDGSEYFGAASQNKNDGKFYTPNGQEVSGIDFVQPGQLNPADMQNLQDQITSHGVPVSLIGKRQATQVLAALPKNVNPTHIEANYKVMTLPANLSSMSYLKSVAPLINDLEQAALSLNNGDYQLWNLVRNKLAQETGDPELTNFESLRTYVAQEVERSLIGSGAMTDSRVKLAFDNLKSSSGPRQWPGIFRALKQAVNARYEATLAVPYPQDLGDMENYLPFPEMKTQSSAKKGNTTKGQTNLKGTPALPPGDYQNRNPGATSSAQPISSDTVMFDENSITQDQKSKIPNTGPENLTGAQPVPNDPLVTIKVNGQLMQIPKSKYDIILERRRMNMEGR